jgi:hypothetical protein
MSTPPSDFDYPNQPLPYALPAQARPGILTTIGIISIIIGSLSTLASLGSVASGIMYLVMSKITFPSPVMTVPAPITVSPQSTTMTSTGNSPPAPAPVAIAPFSFHVAPGASILTISEAALSLCLAVLLIVAGSLTLRDSPTAWRLHRLYLALKIPLIVVAAFATWWTYTSLMSGFNLQVAGAPGMAPMAGFTNMMAVVQAVIWATISMVYPITLLIVLSTRTSKDYLKRIQSGFAT